MSGQVLDTGASLVPTAPALRLDEASSYAHASQWCSDTIGSLVRKPRQHCRRCRRLPTADVTGRASSAARVGQGSLLFCAPAPRQAAMFDASGDAVLAVQMPLSMHKHLLPMCCPQGALGRYLSAVVPGFPAQGLKVFQFSHGQSNPTYLIKVLLCRVRSSPGCVFGTILGCGYAAPCERRSDGQQCSML